MLTPDSGAIGQPVFVLCVGRSGSTLLRFLLDAHPDLACPPETNLPGMAGQLATVWSLISDAPLSKERGDEPPDIPEEAIMGVRRTLDDMVGSYLARRGKKRYCDKSLGTARFVDLLSRIYPEAKFLCLYRHPMDVIASGIEACPWGLNGYGFDPYIVGTPGNAVWALARFWVDNVTAILGAEERYPAACYRVRYEDLVAGPEQVMDEIFSFLGARSAPGIVRQCFATERERFGPADYKIWHTTQVSTGSVGRGWSLPVGMIPLEARDQVNDLAGKLGYVQVGDQWGTAAMPSDLRAPDHQKQASTASIPGRVLPQGRLIQDTLMTGMSQIDERFAKRWAPCITEAFTIAALPGAADATAGPGIYRVDLPARTITTKTSCDEGDDDTAWDIVGTAEVWQAVLTRRMNIGVALRRCDLRYCDSSDTGPVAADIRIGMLSEMVELASPPRQSCRDDL
jgi:hypothetical protein